MANGVDPDQMPGFEASDYLQRPVCPNTWGYYGMFSWRNKKKYKLTQFWLKKTTTKKTQST